MNLHVEWGRPIQLKNASRNSVGYDLDLRKITNQAGVYIFGRRYGSQLEALYVGKAGNIQSRVKGHLNNLRLMQHLRDAKTGQRIVLAGSLVTKRGQKLI